MVPSPSALVRRQLEGCAVGMTPAVGYLLAVCRGLAAAMCWHAGLFPGDAYPA